jgi:pilus assembly protein CpaB
MPVDVYTLEVTPEQSEKVALAASEGNINFALRSATDSDDIYTRGITIPELLASSSYYEVSTVVPEKLQPAEPKETKAAAEPKKIQKKRKWKPRSSITVEIIKGTELKKKKFTL